jgi:alpha-L-arabinofuranosidase
MTLRNPSRLGTSPNLSKFILALLLAVPALCRAQSNLVIYSDSLATGWADQSYSCTKNFANTSPVHSGAHSISVNITGAYGALQLVHSSSISTIGYSYLSFWLNGSTNGGQQLQVYGLLNQGGSATPQPQHFSMNTPLTNTWQQYFVPLAAIGAAGATNFDGFAIQDDAGSAESTFYLDDIQLISVPTPAVVHLTVNAGQPVRTADARWFGMNAAQWDSSLDTPQTIADLTNMGTRAVRLPGGSDSDDFHWLYNRQDQNTWTWASSPANFIHVITNINAQAMTTVNYGTGFTNEAAAWVAYCNATTSNTKALGVDPAGSNWFIAGVWAAIRSAAPLATDDGKNFLRISRSAPLGFKYWEIGNEEYGSWETDSNSVPHDPFTYASRARDYISLMKAVDPTIKIGVVVTPGEDSYTNNFNHPVVNPRTGQTHYGWTPVLLATLKSLGVTPDFIIHHRYPQGAGAESDAGLLQASGGWSFDAANLRQMITDYVGTNGTNIEILCTENNSVSSGDGKQTTSLVNGLFMADSLAQLMQTEFNGLFWWDLENGSDDFGNNNSASLYGWRLYGDYGILEGTNYYPPYYTAKLMQHFVQPGDTVLAATSDYLLLSTYAVQRQDGSVTILTISKDPTNTLTGQLALAGFIPAPAGTIYSYGIPQDNAAEFGTGSPDVAQTNLSGAGTNFSYAFPPYSATVLALSPGPAKLLAVPPPPTPGQVVFQLQGQVGVPYVIQSSPDLVTWTPVSTNKLLATTLNLTNSIAPSTPKQFWRAVWLP